MPPQPSPPEILAQLEQILESAPFRTSKRCSDLLRYVVQETCEGRRDSLKERTLGVAVFDREPAYDTGQDPVVRNTAGQVRKRLAQYYTEPGHDREIRIDLPPGAYVPDIHPAPAEVRNAEPTHELPVEAAQSKTGRRRWLWAGIATALVAVAAILIAMARSKTAEELFWAPIVNKSGAVVLCVGQGHTYKLKGNLDRMFEAAGNPAAVQPQTGSIPLSEITPMWDRYVGLTDVQALVRFATLFSGWGKPIEVRGGRTTSLEDLRGKPSVLIGAFNNSWTLSLTGELRFYFDEDAAHTSYVVRDRLHPGSEQWAVRVDLAASQVAMDYAIVSRVFNPTTERAVVVAAGIKGTGTYAAGEFLTTPAYLEHALKTAPPRWENRNLQFVLATKVFGGNAGPAKVVAAHYW